MSEPTPTEQQGGDVCDFFLAPTTVVADPTAVVEMTKPQQLPIIRTDATNAPQAEGRKSTVASLSSRTGTWSTKGMDSKWISDAHVAQKTPPSHYGSECLNSY